MRKEDGLSRLHMRVARHDDIHVLFCDIDKFLLQIADCRLHFANRGTKHHLRGDGCLIIA